MDPRLLICTDLDRTLIPNGPQSESPAGREHFAQLVAHPEVSLAYVSGRYRALVERAIVNYRLPLPDFVVGDVGTTIYRVGTEQRWDRLSAWEEEIAKDWGSKTHTDLRTLAADIPSRRLQERSNQNAYKLSFYVPLHSDRNELSAMLEARLKASGVTARLIWSTDEPAGIGLSALVHVFNDIGNSAGNTICVQQLDNVRNLIFHLERQFIETLSFIDADAVFFQNPQSCG